MLLVERYQKKKNLRKSCKLDTSIWLVGGHMGTQHYRPSILLFFPNAETSCFLTWYPIPGFGSPGFLLEHESAMICFPVLPRHLPWQQNLAWISFIWLYTNFYVKRQLLTIWSILCIYWKKSQVSLNILWCFWTTSYRIIKQKTCYHYAIHISESLTLFAHGFLENSTAFFGFFPDALAKGEEREACYE